MTSKKLSPEELDELFHVANDTRKFEINLFWKRSTFFILIVGALFVGYVRFEGLLQQLVAIFGFISTLVWSLVGHGSKFWQENWEAHISNLSEKNCKKALIFQQSFRLPNSPFAKGFSVSKSMIVLSYSLLIGWVILILYPFMNLNNSYEDFLTMSLLISVMLIVFLVFLLLVSSKGYSKAIIFFSKRKKSNYERLVQFNKILFEK